MSGVALQGCVTLPSLGEISLERPGSQDFNRVHYSVKPGRISSQDLDLSMGDDGCLSGTFVSWPLQVCLAGGEPEMRVQRFAGSGGEFLVEVIDAGTRIRAAGQLWPGGMKVPGISMHVSVPFGSGPEWDELRRRPALLAVAAALVGVRAGRTQNDDPPVRRRRTPGMRF
jgi:hypothetical protein